MSVADPRSTATPMPGMASGEAGIADVAESRPMRKDVIKRFVGNPLAMIGLTFIVILILVAIFADLIAPMGFAERTDPQVSRGGPGTDYWFGTDIIGRDVFSRVVYGARVSLKIGILATSMILVIGVLFGAAAGYFGGWVDTILMRLTDVFLAIPYIILAISIATVFGRSENAIILVLGATGWLPLSRIVRASFLGLKQLEYVEAATSLGFSRRRIMFGHILPNAMQPVIVYGTVSIGSVILSEAALSFLGVGPQDPTPAWGLMVAQAQGALSTAPHLLLFPSFAIFLTVLSFVFVGDGLRDALDPKLR
ncbi:MAG: ABC transporter permease [Actinomycetota bacterium]|nr:ABC transporter permease [Actinomycetota bacterium]